MFNKECLSCIGTAAAASSAHDIGELSVALIRAVRQLLPDSRCWFGVQLYANAIRKLPLMRSPWEHVIAIGLVGDSKD